MNRLTYEQLVAAERRDYFRAQAMRVICVATAILLAIGVIFAASYWVVKFVFAGSSL